MLKFGQNLLLVGCGGGYDIFCGLPIYFKRLRKNKFTVLVNYSFTNELLLQRGIRVGTSSVYKIDASLFQLPSIEEFVTEIDGKEVPEWLLKQLGITRGTYIEQSANGTSTNGKLYFPEYELSRELGIPVYAFHGEAGGVGIRQGLTELIAQFSINSVVAIDGGTDSLIRGDEKGQGTPHEDMLTLACINSLTSVCPENPLDKYLYILGYNIDIMHDVSDNDVQTRIMDLIREGAFLGASHILNDKDSATSYITTLGRCSPENTWINSLVCASLRGKKEPVVLLNRGTSRVPLNPFMGIYFGFKLEEVVKQKLWRMKEIAESRNDLQVCDLINECFRSVKDS